MRQSKVCAVCGKKFYRDRIQKMSIVKYNDSLWNKRKYCGEKCKSENGKNTQKRIKKIRHDNMTQYESD